MTRLVNMALLVLTTTIVPAFAADNSLGTWKLNVEKSKYTPAPFPIKNLTTVREAFDGGVKVTTIGARADGTKINTSYTVIYDGAEAIVSGDGILYDRISIRQVNANTLTDERKRTGGSYQAVGRTVISKDGKTMTVTVKGKNADGKDFASTMVWDKQ
jgi:hypothetical protein